MLEHKGMTWQSRYAAYLSFTEKKKKKKKKHLSRDEDG